MNFKFVKGDVGSADLMTYVMRSEQIDTVMHFAAQTHVDNSFGNSFEFTENNIRGTHVLLETIKTLGTIKRFLHVSTDEVYGESSYEMDKANVEAASLLEPTNPYSATKAGAEMLVMAYGRSYGLPYVITRGNNVYGPHQYPEKAIPKFIMLARNGARIPIHGDGQATRSYMHVADAASAFDTILHKGELKGVYNIGAHEERTVLSVARDIGVALGVDIDKTITHVQDRKFNDRRYFIDCSKLLALGWTQKVSWEEGLKETIEWYTKNDEKSGYWGNLSGALVAHPTGGKTAVVGEVYSNLEDMMAGAAIDGPDEGGDEDKKPTFLVYGRTGWIGGKLGKLLTEQGHRWMYGAGRLEDRASILDDVKRSKCTHILCAAGVTGRPNVDWCEDHKTETIRANVIGVLNLCDVALENDVHVTNFATGCIYKYDDEHVIGGKPFTETDDPNFGGSFYSETKSYMEMMLRHYPNVMQLRVRMPIDGDLQNPRNFITKIANYAKVVNIPNSMTVLEEFVPMAVEGALRKLTGAYNWTNPGAISHNEVLELYRDYLHPEFTWENFTEEEQAEVIKAPRSNNTMCGKKIRDAFPQVLDIKQSIIKYVMEPNKAKGMKAPIKREIKPAK
jgi:UDP-glucose 4,6-dehydratase